MEPDMHQLAFLFPTIAAQLRSTLSNLHLAAALLAPPAERELNPALDAKAALLDQSYYQLLRLVQNLNYTALLQEEEPLPLKDQDLVKLIDSLCQRSESLCRLLGLELRFVCDMDHHLCAISAPAVEFLMDQLLSNALKFTPSGGVVTVELRRSGEWVMLSVSDTGCGMDEARLATLFDRYLHGELLDPKPYGLGLGLPLCRRIAEGHGGSLVAESRLGRGSRFTLSLPDHLSVSPSLADVPIDYTGGFNPTLLALADALPPEAFLLRNQD